MSTREADQSSLERYSRYGDELRRCLKQRKQSQVQLADAIGLSETSVSFYCNGKILPKREVQEEILAFVENDSLCRNLHHQYEHYKSDADLIEDAFDFGSSTLEGIVKLAQKGHLRQAVSQAEDFLQVSIDYTLRNPLQELLFALHIIQAHYAAGHALAVEVSKDELQDETLRLFRSLAMRGIASRSMSSKGFAAPFHLLKKAFEIAHSEPTIIQLEHVVLVERMYGLQIVSLASTKNEKVIKDVMTTFVKRLRDACNPQDRGNTIEALARCHVRLGNFSEAHNLLGEITEYELKTILTIEERILILRGQIHEMSGRLEEAHHYYRAVMDLCHLKGNLHHKRFADFGVIRVQERLLATD